MPALSQALNANYFIEKAAQKFWFNSCPNIIWDWGIPGNLISKEEALMRLIGLIPLKKTLLKSRLIVAGWLPAFPIVKASGNVSVALLPRKMSRNFA